MTVSGNRMRARDLDALECILRPPSPEELGPFRERAAAARAFCGENGIVLSGYVLGVGDPLIWFSGVENALIAAQEDPGFFQRYAAIVSRWNDARVRILLDAGVDLLIRRGWYESTDFWSPRLFRQFLFQPLRGEIEAARQAGVRTVYVMNSGVVPLLEIIAELGPDVLSNLDPAHTDLLAVKRALGGITLCGGINNYHVLERGTEEDVRKAVRAAVETMAPGGGFILAPGDSILSTDAAARRNFDVLIEAWKRVREG